MVSAVFIHQMGKVGSQALESRLRESMDPGLLRRDHGMAESYFETLGRFVPEEEPLQDFPLYMCNSLRFQLAQADASRRLLRELAEQNKAYVVVSGFREPLSHLVSSCFQSIALLLPFYQQLDNSAGELALLMEKIIHRIVDLAVKGEVSGVSSIDFLSTMARYNTVLWWQREWLELHGVDFNHFSRVDVDNVWNCQVNNVSHWVYQMESGREALPYIAGNILGQEGVDVPLCNASVIKPYAEIYDRVRARIDFDEAVKTFFWTLPYVQCLYSREGAEAIFNEWKAQGARLDIASA